MKKSIKLNSIENCSKSSKLLKNETFGCRNIGCQTDIKETYLPIDTRIKENIIAYTRHLHIQNYLYDKRP